MRSAATAMALATLSAIALGAWAWGCTGLSSDCELNLTCASMSSSSSGGPMCSGIYQPGACNSCLESSCCQELADCNADNLCINDCLFNVWPSPPECSAGPPSIKLMALTACMAAHCSPSCDPKDQCDPVTNAGCPANGSACDAAFPGMFECLPPFGVPAAICAACDLQLGPFCSPGLRCQTSTHKCARYCCNDADCGGAAGSCVLDPTVVFSQPLAVKGAMVGICLDMTAAPICSTPAMAPSKGACVADFP